jgi:hypothetical protein
VVSAQKKRSLQPTDDAGDLGVHTANAAMELSREHSRIGSTFQQVFLATAREVDARKKRLRADGVFVRTLY